MFKIKVCGLTRLEDALHVRSSGADALGLIFCNSPRRVEVEQAKAITQFIDGDIPRIGVFCNQEAKWINKVIQECGLDYVQLHGVESPDFLGTITAPCIKVLSVTGGPSEAEMAWAHSKAAAILLDNGGGGTGKTFEWKHFEAYRTLKKPLILAGGLSPDNVEEAIRRVRPDAVDTSSGVESKPGIKDHRKIECFIAAAQHGFNIVESLNRHCKSLKALDGVGGGEINVTR